jgi:hypothetical protein
VDDERAQAAEAAVTQYVSSATDGSWTTGGTAQVLRDFVMEQFKDADEILLTTATASMALTGVLAIQDGKVTLCTIEGETASFCVLGTLTGVRLESRFTVRDGKPGPESWTLFADGLPAAGLRISTVHLGSDPGSPSRVAGVLEKLQAGRT